MEIEPSRPPQQRKTLSCRRSFFLDLLAMKRADQFTSSFKTKSFSSYFFLAHISDLWLCSIPHPFSLLVTTVFTLVIVVLLAAGCNTPASGGNQPKRSAIVIWFKKNKEMNKTGLEMIQGAYHFRSNFNLNSYERSMIRASEFDIRWNVTHQSIFIGFLQWTSFTVKMWELVIAVTAWFRVTQITHPVTDGDCFQEEKGRGHFPLADFPQNLAIR